jgi:GNAT superfamily N-acetyltransferase
MSERTGLASGRSLAGLIGKRVTIRLKDGAGFRDIVGLLESATSLINRHGEKIQFSPDEIAIWREIIPLEDKAGSGAPLSLRIMELELLSNKTWPAPITVERGGWLYRKAQGVSFRANSVLPKGKAPFGEPIQNVDDEINYCVEYYKSQGQDPTIAVPLPIFQELDSKLESLGWVSEISAHFLVRDLPVEQNFELPEFGFVLSSQPTPEWIAVQQDHDIEEIMRAYPAWYLAVTFEGKYIATARVAVDQKWAIVTRLFVEEAFRGKGLSKALMHQVSSVAAENGASKISLQVDGSNQVALSLYASLGYKIHHSYNYRALR